eukprot:CAMPEP_0167753048 /NCGR_PEP_ID=MMETSP0110_2-20121227/7491_1 /TAXON_ID=629695 /ORGANISM="Gymnochlora sp., Strain CCMP2014" /LENGTH=388 /DNA_ID=CAMNT_0007638759 /DNA_START=11 /DNA_END=1177 /DNA_ORIENTATION=+
MGPFPRRLRVWARATAVLVLIITAILPIFITRKTPPVLRRKLSEIIASVAKNGPQLPPQYTEEQEKMKQTSSMEVYATRTMDNGGNRMIKSTLKVGGILAACTTASALRRSEKFRKRVWEPALSCLNRWWKKYIGIGHMILDTANTLCRSRPFRRRRRHVYYTETPSRESLNFLIDKDVVLGGFNVPDRLLGSTATVIDNLPYGRLLVRVRGFFGSGEELEISPDNIRLWRPPHRDFGNYGWHRRWNSINGPSIEEEFGHIALNLTNKYRKAREGLPSLRWNQALSEIAQRHSRDMAERRVEFGHANFEGRIKRIPFVVRACGENVAFVEGPVDVPDTAVSGWVHSAGHRKNLLDKKFNMCGIGVFRLPESNRWYLTQLFACYPRQDD